MRFLRRSRQQGDGPKSPGIRSERPRGRFDEDLDFRSYDPIAGAYARVHAPRMALVANDLVQLTEVRPGAAVLDVGTGTGVVARAAAIAAGETGIVVGIDPSLQMLAQAVTEDAGPRYAAAAAIDLPFAAAAFGYVLCSFALGHFQSYQTALYDMLRVLAPGGRMGVTAWGPSEDELSRGWQEVSEEFAEHEILQDARQRAMPWADLFSDRNRLKDALHEAGLRDIWVERREYRFEMTAEEYLESREISATGRFLREMLGEELWETFRRQAREVFADRFPPAFNDFRDVNLAVGHKP